MCSHSLPQRAYDRQAEPASRWRIDPGRAIKAFPHLFPVCRSDARTVIFDLDHRHPVALQHANGYRTVRPVVADGVVDEIADRSEEHTSELQSLMRISYAVFCL